MIVKTGKIYDKHKAVKIHRVVTFCWAVLAAMVILMLSDNNYVAAAEVEEIKNNQMEDILGETLFGQYRFNMTGGTNLAFNNVHYWGWIGFNHPYYSETPGWLVHNDSVRNYEKNQGNFGGNSSGGYLSGEEDSKIYKAFLVLESTSDGCITGLKEPDIYGNCLPAGYDNSKGMPAHLITLVAPDGTSIEKSVERYYYSDNEYRRTGIIDVTSFVQSKGYGWYYCCNIPFDMYNQPVGCDAFCGWKLIVVEESANLPLRALSLKAGNKLVSGVGASAGVTIDTGGLKTKMEGEVTGQLLYSFTGADCNPTGSFNVLRYIQDGVQKDVITTSNVRTDSNPFVFLYSRNGVPLDKGISGNGLYSVVSENGWYCLDSNTGDYGMAYPLCASDIELIDVDSINNDKHSVRFDNNVSEVGMDFTVYNSCTLACNILGIAVDVETGTYNMDQECFPVISEGDSKVIVNGTIENKTSNGQVGMLGVLHLKFDERFKVDSINVTSGDVSNVVKVSDCEYELQGVDLTGLYDCVEYEAVLNILNPSEKYVNTAVLDGNIYNNGSKCARINGLLSCTSDTFGNGLDIVYYSSGNPDYSDYIELSYNSQLIKNHSYTKNGYLWDGYRTSSNNKSYKSGDSITVSDYGYTGIFNKKSEKYLGITSDNKATLSHMSLDNMKGLVFCIYDRQNNGEKYWTIEGSAGILTNGGISDGTGEVAFYEGNERREQLWILEPAGDGYVYLKSANGGYLDSDSGIRVSDFTGLDSQKWKFTDNTEILYCVWTPVEYSVVYDAGNTDCDMAPEETYMVYDTEAVIAESDDMTGRNYTVVFDTNKGSGSTTPDGADDISGYLEFKSWLIDSSQYEAGQKVRNLTSIHGSRLLAVAQWKSADITLPYISRRGYSFGGWYYGGTLLSGITITPEKQPYYMKLTANWIPNNYIIALDYNKPENTKKTVQNSSLKEKNVVFDGKIGELPAPSLPGYIFDGWNTKSNGNGLRISGETPYRETEDTTIYAQWKKRKNILLKVGSDTYSSTIIRSDAEKYDEKWYDLWGNKSIGDMKTMGNDQYLQVWSVTREGVRQLTHLD
ncbi:MAG: InlB B-repeat-containing protein [Lachnospira sp.]